MNEERKRILDMLGEGKISAADAEALLDALSGGKATATSTPSGKPFPKYLRVLVEGQQGAQGQKVNVRVPIELIRAGVKLAALLPAGVYDQVNKALQENGLNFDVRQVKPENLDELVQHLAELTVDVENHGETVRVFCE